MRQPREKRGFNRCVCVCMVYALCRVKEGKVGLSSLSGISERVAYCLTKSGLALMQRQPHQSAVQRPATWLTLLQRQPGDLDTSICFGSHVRAADTLTLLIKASATSVTVYRGHRRTLYLPGINTPFIMCIGIIRSNSLEGGRARAESNPGHWARHARLHAHGSPVR